MESLSQIEETTSLTALGLMSGTSLDGLDIAACTFQLNKGKWSYTLNSCETIKYKKEFSDWLSNLFHSNGHELMEAHHKFGVFSALAVQEFLQKNNFKPSIISSHGHTVFHNPKNGFTTQIGCGATIAAFTKTTTICDFRTKDIALGGQGAPLVPVADKLLFNEYDACLNLGGFANISFDEDENRIAFDVCAVNTVLNIYAQKLGYDYDENGKIASHGKIDFGLLSELENLEFYKKPPPKSLGVEFLNEKLLPLLNTHNLSEVDILRTFCEHIANCISTVCNSKPHLKNILITGGGAKNKFLVDLIKSKTNSKITIPENLIIDFKEAISFAFLGILRLMEEKNTLRSVTGATTDSVGGCIYSGS